MQFFTDKNQARKEKLMETNTEKTSETKNRIMNAAMQVMVAFGASTASSVALLG